MSRSPRALAPLILWLSCWTAAGEIARTNVAPRLVNLKAPANVPALGARVTLPAPLSLSPASIDAAALPTATQASQVPPVSRPASLQLHPVAAAAAAAQLRAEDGAPYPGAIGDSRRAGLAFDHYFDGRHARPRSDAPPVRPSRGAPRLAGTDGLSGAALFQRVHEISSRGHAPREYKEARHFMFSAADQIVVNGEKGVIDAYSGTFVAGSSDQGSDYRERGDENGDGRVDRQGMNAEHVWPQSFFAKRPPMRSDLHNLLPTFAYPNEMRATLPFGEVNGRGREYDNDGGAKVSQDVFEPPDSAKGRVARAMLYFYARYHDHNISNGGFSEAFWNDKIQMFLRWNRDFPPTAQERRRNDLVEKFQGNRNPFVDDPGLADRIGVEALRRERRGRPDRALQRSRSRRRR